MSQAALRVVAKEENSEKKRALEAALVQIDRAFGKGSVMKMGARDLGVATDAVSTGSLAINWRNRSASGTACCSSQPLSTTMNSSPP